MYKSQSGSQCNAMQCNAMHWGLGEFCREQIFGVFGIFSNLSNEVRLLNEAARAGRLWRCTDNRNKSQ